MWTAAQSVFEDGYANATLWEHVGASLSRILIAATIAVGLGVPIGLLEDREYDEVPFTVEPGDTILFYSDGVEDQLNAREEHYSRPRLTHLLQRHANAEPQAVVDAVFHDLDAFRDHTPITDDQSTVVIRVHGRAPA